MMGDMLETGDSAQEAGRAAFKKAPTRLGICPASLASRCAIHGLGQRVYLGVPTRTL